MRDFRPVSSLEVDYTIGGSRKFMLQFQEFLFGLIGIIIRELLVGRFQLQLIIQVLTEMLAEGHSDC